MTYIVLITLVLSIVNADRADHGCEPLVLGHRMRVEAQHHTREMVRAGYLFHSDLQPGEGEVVGGTARTVRHLMRSFYRSPEHRRVLRACWLHRIGAGYVSRDGVIWLTLRLRAP